MSHSQPTDKWKCPKCGNEFEYNQRRIVPGYTGWSTGVHECGPNFEAAELQPATEDTKSFWNGVI